MLAKVGPRKLVEWVALPFLGTAPALSLSQLILSGVFDRFPDLQIFFAETRLGWVPFWMEEADYWSERHRHWSERLLECDWPNTRPFAERLFAGVPAGEAYRIAAGNMLDFFHLGDTPMGRTARASAAILAG